MQHSPTPPPLTHTHTYTHNPPLSSGRQAITHRRSVQMPLPPPWRASTLAPILFAGEAGAPAPTIISGPHLPPREGSRHASLSYTPFSCPTAGTTLPRLAESQGLNLLADAAATASLNLQATGSLPLLTQSGDNLPTLLAVTSSLLATPGSYNPAATISLKVVRKILALEFVEMAEITVDDVAQTLGHPPAPTRPPITDISLWLERYVMMAAILATRFPCKAPKLMAYQATIVRAERNYEGKCWVSYDRKFQREALI